MDPKETMNEQYIYTPELLTPIYSIPFTLPEIVPFSELEYQEIKEVLDMLENLKTTNHTGLVVDSATGAKKADGEKLRYDLFPPVALEEITKVLTFGANKYGDNNWRKGLDWSRPYAACMRHLLAWWRGEDTDPETGISHLAHAACNLVFLLEYEKSNQDKDNRYHKVQP